MNNLNRLVQCISVIIIFLYPYISMAQSTFDDYEKYISEKCFNCNEAEENKLIYERAMYADSILKNNVVRFNEKINNIYIGLQKRQIRNSYNKSYKILKKTRRDVFTNYDKLTKDGYNNRYTFLFYWYYTDKMNEILNDMETTLTGDNR